MWASTVVVVVVLVSSYAHVFSVLYMFSIVRTHQPIFAHNRISFFVRVVLTFSYFLLIPTTSPLAADYSASAPCPNHISLNSFDTCSAKWCMRLSYGLFLFTASKNNSIQIAPTETNFYALKWVKIKESNKVF